MSSTRSRYILALAALLLAIAAPAAAQSSDDRGDDNRTEDARPAPSNPERPSLRRRPSPSDNPPPQPRERPRDRQGDSRRTSGAGELPAFAHLRPDFSLG